VGASILHRVGLEELVADSTDDYIRSAVALAHDKNRLENMRSDLRGRMRESELMDSVLFTGTLEEAYCRMWREYCAGHENTD
jgi:predicted O-linked N-acetylglucosamine transferase (SPINDLY family)